MVLYYHILMKKNVFSYGALVLLGMWTSSVWASDCRIIPAQWSITSPSFIEKEYASAKVGSGSHTWATTKQYTDIAIEVRTIFEKGCYVPHIAIYTRDYIDIRYRAHLNANSCLKNYVLLHERRHRDYARYARRHLLPQLQSYVKVAASQTPLNASAAIDIKHNILSYVPIAIEDIRGTWDADLDRREQVTPQILASCRWKEVAP